MVADQQESPTGVNRERQVPAGDFQVDTLVRRVEILDD
jgi:hypothetical protein